MKPVTIVDYWELLTRDDKDFLVRLIKIKGGPQYRNLQIGALPFLNLKMVKHLVRDNQQSHEVAYIYPDMPYMQAKRKHKATRKRVLKHLSPDLLAASKRLKWYQRSSMKQG